MAETTKRASGIDEAPRLEGESSIPSVVAALSLEEKLSLIGEKTAVRTTAIPQFGIPSLTFMDGATGVNGTQSVLDHITDPQVLSRLDADHRRRFGYASPELIALNSADLDQARAEYKDDPEMLALIDAIAAHRPDGQQPISFPSGTLIGASFDPDIARLAGEAVGAELRACGVDACMGPNCDVMRDPRGGRDYEMYGEDPQLVATMARGFVEGLQSRGVAAVAKHLLANTQETERNTRDEHMSSRTLHELYARPFRRVLADGGAQAVMVAYNTINGTPSSRNPSLMRDLLRKQWGFRGPTVSDWGGASQNQPASVAAGMDLLTCGPTDMADVRKAVLDGQIPMNAIDEAVSHLLRLCVWSKNHRADGRGVSRERILAASRDVIAAGTVLLKNEKSLLPLDRSAVVSLYGRRSWHTYEYGSGSTAVPSALHTDVFSSLEKRGVRVVDGQQEGMDGSDVVIYTVAAPSGENTDRADLLIEPEDRENLPRILRQAKAAGKKTIVLLNVSGPVETDTWINDADAVLCYFVPGCMGGETVADLLLGIRHPGGRLPMTFPHRVEDTPCFPCFPGEGSDVYYGEGIYIGYRSYDKRRLDVAFPFGFGLDYTTFAYELLDRDLAFDTRSCSEISVPVRVTNTGSRRGSTVVQIYSQECSPHISRPVKELVGFAKIELAPGESRRVDVSVTAESLRCFDATLDQWVLPIGEHRFLLATDARTILDTATVRVSGPNPYPLNGGNTMREILAVPAAKAAVNDLTHGMFDQIGIEQLNGMLDMRLDDVLSAAMIQTVPDAVRLRSILDDFYRRLADIE